MAISKLSKEATLISDMVNGIGCLSVQQIHTILEKTKGLPESSVEAIIRILTSKKYINVINHTYAVPPFNGTIEPKIINAVWFAIRTICDNVDIEEQTIQTYKSIMADNMPYDLYFLCQNKSYQVVCCVDGNDTKILLAERKYRNLKESSETSNLADYTKTVLLFEDAKYEETILQQIDEKHLTMPHIVAFRDNSQSENEVIFNNYEISDEV